MRWYQLGPLLPDVGERDCGSNVGHTEPLADKVGSGPLCIEPSEGRNNLPLQSRDPYWVLLPWRTTSELYAALVSLFGQPKCRNLRTYNLAAFCRSRGSNTLS